MRKNPENETEQKTNGEEVPVSAAADAATTSGQAAAPADPAQGEGSQSNGAVEQSASDRIAELEKLNAELQDQYLRKAADFDNYRKRMIREKQEAIDFANTNLLVDLVQTLDDFDRAISAFGEVEPGSHAASFVDGVVMIKNQMASMLEGKYGLSYYQATGELFDPNIHEAIATNPSSEVQEPTVAEEFQKGYKLKDRVIRLSKVMVQMPAEKSE